MVNICCVIGCNNKRKSGESFWEGRELTFHRFPVRREPSTARRWVRLIKGRRGAHWQPRDHDRVCSDHFLPGDFLEHNHCRMLKRGAVPTLLTDAYPLDGDTDTEGDCSDVDDSDNGDDDGEENDTEQKDDGRGDKDEFEVIGGTRVKVLREDLSKIRRPFEASLKMAYESSRHSLPLSRVKTIMKSSPEVQSISQEALHLTGKSTELFIQALAKFSYQQSDRKGTLNYGDLAEIVNSEDTLQFLHDIVPRKVKAKDYLAMMALKNDDDDS